MEKTLKIFKFGLIDSPSCKNCDANLETIEHKLIGCPKAIECWRALDKLKTEMNTITDGHGSLEEVLGTSGTCSKLSLALNCELLQRLVSQGGKAYHPQVLVKAVTRSIFINEPMNLETRDKLRKLINPNQ